MNNKNWKENKLPCSGNHLIFPKQIPRVLISGLTKSIHLTDIDLPLNGEIILDESVTITSGNIESEVHECDFTVSHFIKVEPDYWYNPFNWCETRSNVSQCLHKPQVEASMVPSASDIVVFPAHNSFYVAFNPSEPRILAKSIFFRNQTYTNSQRFRQRIRRTFFRKIVEFVNINKTYPPDFELQGNTCKKNYCSMNSNLEIDRMKSICQYVICQPQVCHQQVKPKGSCCSLCGHILMVKTVSISDKSRFDRWLNNLLFNDYQYEIIFDLLSTDPKQFQLTISSIKNELHLSDVTEKIKNTIYEQRRINGAQSVDCISCKPSIPHPVQAKINLAVSILIVIIIVIFFVVSLLLIIHKKPEVISLIRIRLPTTPKITIPTINLNFFNSRFPRFRLKEPYDDNLGTSSDGAENIELPQTGIEVSFDNPIYVPEINDSKQ